MSDWRARLLALARGDKGPVTGVTDVTGVTTPPVTGEVTAPNPCGYASYAGYASSCISGREQHERGVTASVTMPDEDELSERAAMAEHAGGVPAEYALEFAALQLVCPAGMAVARWQQTVNDAGLLLDRWGSEAERLGWRSEELFGPDGLVWAMQGGAVTELTRVGATLSDGRVFHRMAAESLGSATWAVPTHRPSKVTFG